MSKCWWLGWAGHQAQRHSPYLRLLDILVTVSHQLQRIIIVCACLWVEWHSWTTIAGQSTLLCLLPLINKVSEHSRGPTTAALCYMARKRSLFVAGCYSKVILVGSWLYWQNTASCRIPCAHSFGSNIKTENIMPTMSGQAASKLKIVTTLYFFQMLYHNTGAKKHGFH